MEQILDVGILLFYFVYERLFLWDKRIALNDVIWIIND